MSYIILGLGVRINLISYPWEIHSNNSFGNLRGGTSVAFFIFADTYEMSLKTGFGANYVTGMTLNIALITFIQNDMVRGLSGGAK